jgi:hypothetical protein
MSGESEASMHHHQQTRQALKKLSTVLGLEAANEAFIIPTNASIGDKLIDGRIANVVRVFHLHSSRLVESQVKVAKTRHFS